MTALWSHCCPWKVWVGRDARQAESIWWGCWLRGGKWTGQYNSCVYLLDQSSKEQVRQNQHFRRSCGSDYVEHHPPALFFFSPFIPGNRIWEDFVEELLQHLLRCSKVRREIVHKDAVLSWCSTTQIIMSKKHVLWKRRPGHKRKGRREEKKRKRKTTWVKNERKKRKSTNKNIEKSNAQKKRERTGGEKKGRDEER